jgi:tripartite-type tricarboxylate transporter receptor subunit TctC
MTFDKSTKRLGAAMALVSEIALVPQANADAVSDFYSGKQVALQVGFGAGGGYDTTARIVARHLGKHIPGKPAVIV